MSADTNTTRTISRTATVNTPRVHVWGGEAGVSFLSRKIGENGQHEECTCSYRLAYSHSSIHVRVNGRRVQPDMRLHLLSQRAYGFSLSCDDAMKWVIVVSFSDRSGIMGVYGPYDTKEVAERAISLLQSLPGMETVGGYWEVYHTFTVAIADMPTKK